LVGDQQKANLEYFNKQDIKDFNLAMIKIESEKDNAIKKASKELKVQLKTLIYYTSTTEELNCLIENMIKEIHIEIDSDMTEKT